MINIAVFAFEGISLFHLSVPTTTFNDAYGAEQSPFNIKVCGEQTGEIMTSSGVNIRIDYGLTALAQADILIFPSWLPEHKPSEQLVKIINQANANNKIIVGLCLGTYALAYAGIIEQQKVTTHWAYGDDLTQRFPKINYHEDPLYIQQGNIITSAGTAAAIDCCLYLLKDLQGSKIANHVGRMMVAAPQRHGGQKQFIAKPVLVNSQDQRINTLIEKVLNNLTVNYSLNDAAAHCFMSTRSFSRRFKQYFSMSFVEWLTHARLTHSQHLLESTRLSISQVAEQSGFNTEQNFRKQFKLHYKVLPRDWRNSFNSDYHG